MGSERLAMLRMGGHTQCWILLLLILTQCQSQGVDTPGPDEDIPSLSEAVELLQINEIMSLNQILADKANEEKKKDDENQRLKQEYHQMQEEREIVVRQHLAEKEIMEKELKGSKVLLKFMMNALYQIEEVMRDRETTIAKQAEMAIRSHE